MTRVTRYSTRYSDNVKKSTGAVKTSNLKVQEIIDSEDDDTTTTVDLKLSTPKKSRRGRTKTAESDLIQLSPTTPQKQQKREILQTPQAKQVEFKNCETPSSLFHQLSLTSPKSVNNKSKKKCLFKENEQSEDLQNNSVENISEKTNNSIYRDARKALHSSLPTKMPGRELELDSLKNWLINHRLERKSGSLYISGPPGTGKTASLTVILEEKGIQDQFIKVYVNCTSIKSPKAIYSRIFKELNIKSNAKTEKEYISAIENYMKRRKHMILLILDEIDQLESKNQSILYTIFEWPSKPDFQLLLIGIANALDLTDRILPRLQARCELKPELMHFAPYTKQQIVQILTNRLSEASVLDVFSSVALQMLAGKVAAISGDVRRALDIARRVIELVDKSRKNETLTSIENMATEVIKEETKAVELKEVLNVLNNVYGTSQNLTRESEDSFPLQQKIALCSLILMLRKAKNKDITIGKLHDVYRRVCVKRKITAVDQSEFIGLCNLIETRGIIRVSRKKETRLHKVYLEWDEDEVNAALKDKQLMSTIIQDVNCLGNY